MPILWSCSVALARRSPYRHTLAGGHNCFFPVQGLDGGVANHASRGASASGRFWFPVQTKAADGGTKPEPSGSCSVSSAPPHIAFQRVKGARRTFSARAPPVSRSPETFVAKAQLHFSGLSTRALAQRRKPTAYRQARLNSRNRLIITTLAHIVNSPSTHLRRGCRRLRGSARRNELDRAPICPILELLLPRTLKPATRPSTLTVFPNKTARAPGIGREEVACNLAVPTFY